jgi:hypothetical protein
VERKSELFIMKKITACILQVIVFALQGCGGGGESDITSVPVTATQPPNVTSSASHTAVGNSYTVSWSSQGKPSCNSSGAWNEDIQPSGTLSFTPIVAGDLIYNITCGSDTASASIKILPEYTSIPDSKFEQALITLNIDDAIDGRVKTEKILAVKDLWIISTPDNYKHPAFFANLGYMFGSYSILPVTNFFSDIRTPFTGGGKITDLTGIENFVNLEVLSISAQNFTTINLNTLNKLKWLSLNKIPLNSIDLKTQNGLSFLGITETPLTNLDISALTNLAQLEIHNDGMMTLPYTTANGVAVNGINSIDLSKQPDLIRLYCSNNKLTSLNFNNNKKLQELWAASNLFTTLDLSGMSTLNYIILTNSSELVDLNIKGVAGDGIPYRLYTTTSPKLTQIKVSSVEAIQDRISAITANTPTGQSLALGLYWDSWTVLTNAP